MTKLAVAAGPTAIFKPKNMKVDETANINNKVDLIISGRSEEILPPPPPFGDLDLLDTEVGLPVLLAERSSCSVGKFIVLRSFVMKKMPVWTVYDVCLGPLGCVKRERGYFS